MSFVNKAKESECEKFSLLSSQVNITSPGFDTGKYHLIQSITPVNRPLQPFDPYQITLVQTGGFEPLRIQASMVS